MFLCSGVCGAGFCLSFVHEPGDVNKTILKTNTKTYRTALDVALY